MYLGNREVKMAISTHAATIWSGQPIVLNERFELTIWTTQGDRIGMGLMHLSIRSPEFSSFHNGHNAWI
jgi:hypothetical protein